MDKEIEEIAPKNLDGSNTVVNTVKKASAEEVAQAAAAEKEKKEDYYVDPLEQDALMKEKLAKIEERKELERKRSGEEEPEKTETTTSSDETIRPDMNVSGYFSTGATAKKDSIMKRPASSSSLTLCLVFGVINGIYSVCYFALLVASGFNIHWFMNWIFYIVVAASVIIIFTSVRSLKVQNANLKRNALVGIVGSAIALSPLIGWFIHWLMQIF